jgi:hydrogenase large subunit
VGGVANAINLDSEAALNVDRLYQMKTLLDKVVNFVQKVYVPDVCAIAGMYPEWFGYGAGVTNYLSVPDLPLDERSTEYELPGGTIMNGDLSTYKPIKGPNDEYWRRGVTESAKHSWYKNDEALHPWKGETEPQFTGWKEDAKYSWVKSPRFEGKPMQVGPLANVLVGYAAGNPLMKKWTDAALSSISSIAKVQATPAMLHSTLGRHGARAIRAAVLSELAVKHWQNLVDNILKGDMDIYNPPVFPKEAIEGVGFHEAPRGTLSHWVVVEGGTIKNYQAVVPTTWNASPRDENGTVGPYEASLLKNPVADANHPLEVVRTIHSFDPCMACAVHTFDAEGKNVAKVKVL